MASGTAPSRTSTDSPTMPACSGTIVNCRSELPPPAGSSNESVSLPLIVTLVLGTTCTVSRRSGKARNVVAIPAMAAVAASFLRDSRTVSVAGLATTGYAGSSARRCAVTGSTAGGSPAGGSARVTDGSARGSAVAGGPSSTAPPR